MEQAPRARHATTPRAAQEAQVGPPRTCRRVGCRQSGWAGCHGFEPTKWTPTALRITAPSMLSLLATTGLCGAPWDPP